MMHVYIGTSGWNYKGWVGNFYPERIRARDMLEAYVEHFDTVEINATFYRLPTLTTTARWAETAPKHFRFACKASRYTTHTKRLKDAPASFALFFERIAPLGRKLGPVLFQTPPHFEPDAGRLASFLAALPRGGRYVFEFRDERWLDDDIRRMLEKARAGFCISDLGGHTSPLWRTARFVYLRLHGPKEKYRGSYSDAALRQWADRIADWVAERADVYCYFDNDEKGFAPRDAARLRAMVEGGIPRPHADEERLQGASRSTRARDT